MPTTLDEALELLHRYGPEYGPLELANHGPMAVEALRAMNREDAIGPWVDAYVQQLDAPPSARDPIHAESWRDALGDGRRAADWAAFFEAELRDGPWPQMVNRWVERLAPGIITAAAHGVIRTAHACRSLAQSDTAERRRELCLGLAYWAARYDRAPGELGPHPAPALPSAAIERVAILPPERRNGKFLIVEQLEALESYRPFTAAADLVDPAPDPRAFLDDLTGVAASIYLANAAHTDLIGIVHVLTGASAVRLLEPHLDTAVTARTLRFAWQALAALYAVFAERAAPAEIPSADVDRETLVDRAIATGDEHAIKFTEACLREEAVQHRPLFRAAAADAVARFEK